MFILYVLQYELQLLKLMILGNVKWLQNNLVILLVFGSFIDWRRLEEILRM